MTVEADRILEALLGALDKAPDGVRRDDLAEFLQTDAAVLDRAWAALKKEGFEVREEEGLWTLVRTPDRLLPHWVRARLRTDRIGAMIYYRDEMPSTQDVAFELIVEGRPHGTLVVAEHQTSGRGRSDRDWVSTHGRGLLFSIVLELEPPDTFASVLTVATATAVARGIRQVTDLPATIKFPNDILVRGKKVAGILIEAKDYGVPPPRAVVGVGINVNEALDDLPEDLRESATSLRLERRDQEPISRVALLRRILTELERWLDQIALGRFEVLDEAWSRLSGLEDREVAFVCGGEPVRGRVLEAGIREGLLLRSAGGKEQRYRLEHIIDLRVS